MRILLGLLLSVLISPLAFNQEPQDIVVIKDPLPNCVESKYVELKIDKALTEISKSKVYLLKPYSLVVDSMANIFVFDVGQSCIIKYDKNLNPITSFGRHGQGPGDFAEPQIELSIRNDILYAGDRMNKRITLFNTDGKVISECKIPILTYGYINPVVDSKGNYYLISKKNLIDIYNPQGILIKSLLNRGDLAYSLYYAPAKTLIEFFQISLPMNNSIACTQDDDILTLLLYSGKYFFQKKGLVTVEKYLWPKEALAMYKKEAPAVIENDMQRKFFGPIILDLDNKGIFYSWVTPLNDSKRALLYEFTVQGELNRVLYFAEEPSKGFYEIMFKRHGYFYAIGINRQDEKNIALYKEN